METIDPARIAYEAMAGVYDEFTHRNDYEAWFKILLPKLERLGLKHGVLLDVGCGTGRAFAPMLRRGWQIMARDMSAAMVAEAIAKHPEVVDIGVGDMRGLPMIREFQLVWALNDPVNYLLGDDDLLTAVRAMGANLAEDGLLVFDCNTRRGMDDLFGVSGQEGELDWKGFGRDDEDCYEAELSGTGISSHRHRERYRSVTEAQRAIRDAGLQPLAAMGQSEGADGIFIADDWDEERDSKVIHVAGRR